MNLKNGKIEEKYIFFIQQRLLLAIYAKPSGKK
jgi:hypothetical protein